MIGPLAGSRQRENPERRSTKREREAGFVQRKAGRSLGLLDRSRRHLHRRDRPRPARAAASAKLLSESPAYADAAVEAIRDLLAPRSGRADSGRRDRRRQDGNDGRHQRAARAARRAHAAGDDARLSRCARDRLPGAPENLRARTSSSPSNSIPASSRSTSACAPTARSRPRPILIRFAPRSPRRGLRATTAIAIVFMHAYRYPAHERQVAQIARELGFAQVSDSHVASALIKLVSRGDTTVVDAYLSPILARYVGQVSRELDIKRTGARVMFMMSSGGLTSADLFAGKDAILSGPAGGVVAMARTGISAGFERIIGFDMGGTSTDVAHFDGAIRARVRDRSRGRAHARADDEDPYGRGGRRLDPRIRRRALSRRPRFSRRRSRTRCLSPRRSAHGHRRQSDDGQADPRFLPQGVRPGQRRAAR